MENKDRRHKVEDREEFTNSQKDAIAAKSDDCCVWCGKKVYFKYGATVDHFVPLKKGGTNEFVNLVMMCDECNQKKGSKVVPAHIAANYLKEKPRKELEDYFENYIHTYDYISRGNLLACDMYSMYLLPEVAADAAYRAQKKGKSLDHVFNKTNYILKRAYPDDETKVTEYYIKYLKKYSLLDSPEAASENIKFWMRFGAIYYVEKKDEIQIISAVTMNCHGYLSITLFSYYSTLQAHTITRGIVTCLSDAILGENELLYLPISVNMLACDKLTPRILNLSRSKIADDRLACQTYFTYSDKYPRDDSSDEARQLFKEGVNKYRDFVVKFKDIGDTIAIYLYENNLMDYTWMADEILERDFFPAESYDTAKEYLND